MPYEVSIELDGPRLAQDETALVIDNLAARGASVAHTDRSSWVSVLMPGENLGDAVATTLTELCRVTTREPVSVRAGAAGSTDLTRLLGISPELIDELIATGRLLPPTPDA